MFIKCPQCGESDYWVDYGPTSHKCGFSNVSNGASRDEMRMDNLRMLPQLKSLKILIDAAILTIESGTVTATNIDEMVNYAKKAVV